jgi:hypothetical protein
MDNAKSGGRVPADGEIPEPKKVNKYQECRSLIWAQQAFRDRLVDHVRSRGQGGLRGRGRRLNLCENADF